MGLKKRAVTGKGRVSIKRAVVRKGGSSYCKVREGLHATVPSNGIWGGGLLPREADKKSSFKWSLKKKCGCPKGSRKN